MTHFMRYTLIGVMAAGTSVCAYAQDDDFDALLDGLLEDSAIEEAVTPEEDELIADAPAEEPALDEADIPAEEDIADLPADEEIADEPAEDIADVPAEEELVEDAVAEVEDIPADEPAEELVDEVAEDVVADIEAEEPTEEIVEEAAEDVVADIEADEPAEEIVEETADDVIADIEEESVEDIVDEAVGDDVAEVETEEPVEEVVDDTDLVDDAAPVDVDAILEAEDATAATEEVADAEADADLQDENADLVADTIAEQEGAENGLLGNVATGTEALEAQTEADVAFNDLAMLHRIKNKGLENHAIACLQRAREILKTPAPAGKAQAHYENAIKMYEDALKYFTDVQREDLAELRKECSCGIEEAYYRWALALYNEGDLNAALLQAQEPNLKGHAMAQKLITQIKEELSRPKEFRPEPVLPEYARDAYKEERLVIMDRLQRATTYYHLAKYKEANDQLELILRDDPSNESAIDLRRRIDRRDSERKRQLKYSTHAEMIGQVEANWTPLGALGRHSEELYTPVVSKGESVRVDDDGKKEAAIITEKLNYIRLPEFSIRPPSTLADAVKILADASNDYDRPELPPEEKGISFVLNIGSNPAASSEEPAEEEDLFASEDSSASSGLPPIQNIHMPWVTLKDALDMLCEVTGTKYIIKGKSVVIVPANYVDGKMETRSYNVMSTIVERVGQINSELSAGGGSDDWSTDSSASDMGGASDSTMWKQLFTDLGVPFEGKASIVYLSSIGKLRVTNTPENLALFENVLEELNVTPYQIEVEARFVEVSQADMNSLGFEWRLNSDIVGTVGSGIDWLSDSISSNANSGLAAGGIGADGHVFHPNSGNPNAKTGNFAIHGGATALNQGVRYIGNSSAYANRINLGNNTIAPDDTFASFSAVFGRVDMTMILHMLAQRTDTDMLSSPKVLARPGQEAMIRVVTEWIYPTEFDVTELEEAEQNYNSGGNNSLLGGSAQQLQAPPVKFAVEPQSFEKQEVGVSLTVVPEVSQEGQMINLLVNPKVVEYLGDFEYGMQVPYIQYEYTGNQITGAEVQYYQVSMPQPKFHFREISTYLSVYNGSTVVMGGLITETRNSFEDKVPILGDLPFIGFLFRSSGEYSEKRNLLIFLTARLVDPAGRPLKTATDGRTGTSAMDSGSASTMSSTIQ